MLEALGDIPPIEFEEAYYRRQGLTAETGFAGSPTSDDQAMARVRGRTISEAAGSCRPRMEENMTKLSRSTTVWLAAASLFIGVLPLAPGRAFAHCDGLDGPVVMAARQALEKDDASQVLIWVQKKDEAEVRRAFKQTLAVRKLGPQAGELADMYFFETVVRVHRAGEGAPYTGLKPAGRDLGPAIPGADRALETGEVEPLVRLLAGAVEKGVRERFAEARAARNYPAGNVEAGRDYIEKYVPFIHYVERLYQAATTSAPGHETEAEATMQHEE